MLSLNLTALSNLVFAIASTFAESAFVLTDSEDQTQISFAAEDLTIAEDMATDDEILAAELETDQQIDPQTEGQV